MKTPVSEQALAAMPESDKALTNAMQSVSEAVRMLLANIAGKPTHFTLLVHLEGGGSLYAKTMSDADTIDALASTAIHISDSAEAQIDEATKTAPASGMMH